ncbi:hypothetical protein H5410_032322 [Solanum commersonii]|uniref:Uncharacterized protein n=1 Tax=Solanum commersonii TaxID=4109 RepID=A0A9J5YMM3_SOLCO|nr:hypothetical protein H5410_032322 [Solanum commersonii]
MRSPKILKNKNYITKGDLLFDQATKPVDSPAETPPPANFNSTDPSPAATSTASALRLLAKPTTQKKQKKVRRPDNGSKTLSELKLQVTLCSYEIIDLILFLGI